MITLVKAEVDSPRPREATLCASGKGLGLDPIGKPSGQAVDLLCLDFRQTSTRLASF